MKHWYMNGTSMVFCSYQLQNMEAWYKQRCEMVNGIEVDYFVGIPEHRRKWEDIHHAAPSPKSHSRYHGHHAAAKLPESRAPVVA